jgi:hypothetical protein
MVIALQINLHAEIYNIQKLYFAQIQLNNVPFIKLFFQNKMIKYMINGPIYKFNLIFGYIMIIKGIKLLLLTLMILIKMLLNNKILCLQVNLE